MNNPLPTTPVKNAWLAGLERQECMAFLSALGVSFSTYTIDTLYRRLDSGLGAGQAHWNNTLLAQFLNGRRNNA